MKIPPEYQVEVKAVKVAFDSFIKQLDGIERTEEYKRRIWKEFWLHLHREIKNGQNSKGDSQSKQAIGHV
jgi:hypothetical protein